MNKKIFLGIAIFWLVIILSFVAFKEFTLTTGEEVLLKTQPVDPRDLFRGDYVILRYEISTIDTLELTEDLLEANDNVFVMLEEKEGYGTPVAIYKEAPKEGVFLKGKVIQAKENSVSIEYGIESYFVPEGKGMDIQRNRDLEVLVSIDKYGNSVIKWLLIDGKKVSFE